MPRYLISVLVLAAILMIVGTAGCIAQPTVVVDSVRIGSLTPANTTLQVLVRVTNPNSFDIPLQNVSFTVYSVEASGTRRLGEGADRPVHPARPADGRSRRCRSRSTTRPFSRPRWSRCAPVRAA